MLAASWLSSFWAFILSRRAASSSAPPAVPSAPAGLGASLTAWSSEVLMVILPLAEIVEASTTLGRRTA
jgi:hypothetical protein